VDLSSGAMLEYKGNPVIKDINISSGGAMKKVE
jgi:hypothetical protein